MSFSCDRIPELVTSSYQSRDFDRINDELDQQIHQVSAIVQIERVHPFVMNESSVRYIAKPWDLD